MDDIFGCVRSHLMRTSRHLTEISLNLVFISLSILFSYAFVLIRRFFRSLAIKMSELFWILYVFVFTDETQELVSRSLLLNSLMWFLAVWPSLRPLPLYMTCNRLKPCHYLCSLNFSLALHLVQSNGFVVWVHLSING